ncbi:ATP-binding cassette domain-containing protein, partial [Streptomyces sp. NPDC058171]
LEPTTLVLLVIPAMSAGLLGGFSSFPSTLATALALGVGQSLIQRYVSAPGWAMAVPFFVVLAILLARGRALPLRSYVLERLPAVGTGRVRPVPVALLTFGAAALITVVMNANWATATVVTLSTAIIGVSVVVLTGYTGQLSLAQVALAGIGALMASRLAVVGVPFLLACLAGAILTALLGLVISIPALRVRGITLAVVTWGLAAALTNLVLLNGEYTGGFGGFEVPVPSVLGVDLDPFFYPDRYALFVLLILVAVAIGVANLRRGQVGRRLLAVRSNERAAASLGVHVTATKSYAFALSAAIASLGGTFLVFSRPVAEFSAFTLFLGIVVVAVTVVGGVGYLPGALLGATLVGGGVTGMIFEGLPQVNYYMPLVGGIFLLLILILAPDGLFEMHRQQLAAVPWRRLLPVPGRGASAPKRAPAPASAPVVVTPKELVVENLSVSFGGVHAVRDVSITVKPGEIHGVMGPNGAGKTTLIDGITGFVKSTATSIRVGDQELSGLSTRQRVRAGVSRSFQSLELFSGLTVRENLAIAGERPGVLRYLLDLVRPGSATLTPAAWEAVTHFEL